MPDPFRPVLRGDDPLALIYCFIRPGWINVRLDGFTDAVRALSPVLKRRNVLQRIPGEPGPTLAHLQNAVPFVLDNKRNWGLDDHPIENTNDLVL